MLCNFLKKSGDFLYLSLGKFKWHWSLFLKGTFPGTHLGFMILWQIYRCLLWVEFCQFIFSTKSSILPKFSKSQALN